MVTAGDDFLRNVLETGENTALTRANPATGGSGQPVPSPTMPTSERGTQAQTEIDEATRQAREAEKRRVEEASAPWWSATPDDSAKGGGGASGPGGYRFDPETMAALIGKWEKFHDDIRNDGRELQQRVEHLKRPSPDQPATEQTEATTASVNAAIDQNFGMQQYARNYIVALRKANGTYVRQEEDVAGGLNGDTSGTGDLYK